MKKTDNQIGRRDFLKSVGLTAPLILAAPAMLTGCATQKSALADFFVSHLSGLN